MNKKEIDSKKESKKNLNNKILYTCESKIDAYEYKKMVKYFPHIYWNYVIWLTLINLVFSAIIAIATRSISETLIFFITYQVIFMVICKLRIEYIVEKSFNSMEKKGGIDTELHTEFYDEYFIRKGKSVTYKINYSDIDRCIESDTNFYLKWSKQNKIIIIQKNACNLELISFLRKIFKDLENHLGDNSKFKGVKKINNPKFVENLLLALFILTILSLCGALWTQTIAIKINNLPGHQVTKTMWVFWCWLPIPILSIILGFKYKKAGFKCTKNIVIGFIIGILLLVYGSFSLMPTFTEDYKKIYEYKDIIDIELPTNGELEIQDWETYLDEDKTEYKIINVYYDKEDTTKLVHSIENNKNWILSTDLKSKLKIFIPSALFFDDDSYFSIYNKTLNEYNTLPENSGDYEIYAMKYDKSDKYLEIHKYNYSYN